MAHELRSPVAALVALADAAPALRGPAERRRLLDLAVAAGRDIERILSDPELLSLRPVLVDVGGLVAGLAADRVEVAVEGRPEATADATRLRQAVANLVANGLRHGTRVEIQVTETDGEVVVDVTDDGPGVAPGLDPFARGVSGAGSLGPRALAGSGDRRGARWLARARSRHGARGAVQAGSTVRFRRGLSPSSDWSDCARAATARRIAAGSSTTVSPRSASTSESSHSSVLNVTSAIADLSVSARAPRSSFQRAIGGPCHRCATAGSAR